MANVQLNDGDNEYIEYDNDVAFTDDDNDDVQNVVAFLVAFVERSKGYTIMMLTMMSNSIIMMNFVIVVIFALNFSAAKEVSGLEQFLFRVRLGSGVRLCQDKFVTKL